MDPYKKGANFDLGEKRGFWRHKRHCVTPAVRPGAWAWPAAPAGRLRERAAFRRRLKRATRPAWAVQLQYDFLGQKLLSYLANHIAITLHKAESTLLKTPSILLLIPPLMLLLIPLLLLRERGLTLRADHQRIRQPLCWGGLAGSGSGLAGCGVAVAGWPGAGILARAGVVYPLYNCALFIACITGGPPAV